MSLGRCECVCHINSSPSVDRWRLKDRRNMSVSGGVMLPSLQCVFPKTHSVSINDLTKETWKPPLVCISLVKNSLCLLGFSPSLSIFWCCPTQLSSGYLNVEFPTVFDATNTKRLLPHVSPRTPPPSPPGHFNLLMSFCLYLLVGYLPPEMHSCLRGRCQYQCYTATCCAQTVTTNPTAFYSLNVFCSVCVMGV